jgi:two-component system, OmpR family, sensor histidine kinase KdpD
MRRRWPLVRSALIVLASLTVTTVAVEVLEQWFGVADASSLYLVAVVLCALLVGTAGAIAVAVGAFVVYGFVFTEPRFTFEIHDPGVLLSVVLLLFVGIVVGELAALERARGDAARAREREARALFAVSRLLATRASMAEALTRIVLELRIEAGMERVWVSIGPDPATEHPAADTADGPSPPPHQRFRVLQRLPDEEPARWVLVQRPGGPPAAAPAGAPVGPGATTTDAYRVRIEASGDLLGSIWALRARDRGEPDVTATRLMAAAADQIGQALTHESAEAQARAAEIARQSDSLKSALLQSVSHDLRTPLAAIRAAAGGLRPGTSLSEDGQRASADAIDREVEYLDRLVTNLLDLSRIEAGALRARRDVFELDDALGRVIERTRARLGARTLELDLAATPVEIDPVFLDEAVANVLDNAVKYTPDGARLRVTAREDPPGRVRLTIEDDGPGVSDDALTRLFDKFYRAPGAPGGSRGGSGIGLAVARGLIEATGGTAVARRSELGGLAIDLDLPMATLPAELTVGTSG